MATKTRSGIVERMTESARDQLRQRAMDQVVQVALGGPQDMLRNIFWMQERLQEKRPVGDLKTNVIGIMTEAAELMEQVDWKPWKPHPTIRQLVTEELVDVMHFVVNVAISLGMTAEDFHEAYRQKHRKNMSRPDHIGS